MNEDSSYPEAGFARLAGNFVKAASRLAGQDSAAERVSGQGFLPLLFPFLFLIGHALELAYKAVLVVNGATETDLKSRLGHDLVGCRRGVQACCPELLKDLEESGTDEIVGSIGPYYQTKAFEYSRTGIYSGLPAPPDQVATIVAGTVGNIQKWVRSRVRQRIRDARSGIANEDPPTSPRD